MLPSILLVLLLLVVGIAGAAPFLGTIVGRDGREQLADEYDYVIIGGGTVRARNPSAILLPSGLLFPPVPRPPPPPPLLSFVHQSRAKKRGIEVGVYSSRPA